jgi:hypothetical protein
MKGSTMVGYWSPKCPVKTDKPNVLATVYLKPGKVLIALASWNPDRVTCSLSIDWKAIGLDPEKAVLRAHAAKDFQPEMKFSPHEVIPVEPGKGWLLVLSERP